MYSAVSVVGERGQITIPKIIRENEGLKPRDKVIVSILNGKIVVSKLGKKATRDLMIEGYKALDKQGVELAEEMKYVSKEADELLDGY